MAYAQHDGRNYPLDRTEPLIVLRRFKELTLAAKRHNLTEYGFFLKEVDDELQKAAMKADQSVVEMSLLNQQTIRSQQMMESYNESLLQVSRTVPSFPNFSHPHNMNVVPYHHFSGLPQGSRRPFGQQNNLSSILECSQRPEGRPCLLNGSQLSRNGLNPEERINTSRVNNSRVNSSFSRLQSLAQSRIVDPVREPARMPHEPPNFEPIRPIGQLHRDEERVPRVNLTRFTPGVTRAVVPSLPDRTIDMPESSSRSRNNSFSEDTNQVVVEVPTAPRPSHELEMDSEFDSSTDSDGREKENTEPSLVDQSRKKNPKVEKRRKNATPGKPDTQCVLKKWSVMLREDNLILRGKLYKNQHLEHPNHLSKPIKSRKKDGTIVTAGKNYVLDGTVAWSGKADPPAHVKKLFEKKFPICWRMALKLWRSDMAATKKKKANQKNQMKSRSSVESSRSDEDNTRNIPTKKQAIIKSRRESRSSVESSSSDQDNAKNIPIKKQVPKKPAMSKKTVAATQKSKKKSNTDERENAPKNPGAKKDKTNSKATEKFDMFDQLNLEVPRVGVSAMTPNTFVKAISKNAVRIGAHTPTLKTFVDDNPSATTVPPVLPSKAKKDDVVSMRLAKTIESGQGKAGTKTKKNGGKTANKRAIDGIMNQPKNISAKMLKKIRERFDDSELTTESDSDSSESD